MYDFLLSTDLYSVRTKVYNIYMYFQLNYLSTPNWLKSSGCTVRMYMYKYKYDKFYFATI